MQVVMMLLSAACLLGASLSADAATPLPLSAAEARWIEENPVVRFAAESGLPPLEDVEDGRYVGLFAQYVDAVARRSGLRMELVPTRDWKEAQQLFLDGKIDMLANAAPDRVSAQVRERTRFSEPYYASPIIVIAPAGGHIVFRREQLRGLRIAFRSRGGTNEKALDNLIPDARATAYPDADTAMQAVADGRADVLVGTEALYPPLLRSQYMGELGVAGMLDAVPYQAMFGIRQDKPELLGIINKVLGTLTAAETDRFYEEGFVEADYGEPTLRSIAHYRSSELVLLSALIALLAAVTVWAYRASNKAKRSEAAKAVFLATMSHEIRTPINTIIGAVEALERSKLAPEEQELVDITATAAEALTDLLDNVLDLSKMDAQRLELERLPTDVERLLNHATVVAAMAGRQKGLRVTLRSQGLEQPLMVDPTRLRQVVTNLLGNAVKFTNEGSVTLSASFESGGTESDAGTLDVEVADTGIGIAPERHARLFEAYTQADQSTTRRYGGTGLGLTICRELILLMRGHIELDSRVGEGTRVHFRIPVERGLLQHGPVVVESDTAASVISPGVATHVLVAEDHEVSGRLISNQLASMGVSLDLVTDGEQAIQAVARRHYDMVLMDCHMPGMDGYDAALAIRQRPAQGTHLPIIAISAATDAAHLQRCDASGMDGVLRKPIRMVDLMGMLGLWGLEYTMPPEATEAPAVARLPPGSLEESLLEDAVAVASAWIRSDAPRIAHHAHRLRGAAAMAGLHDLDMAATQLEELVGLQQHVPLTALVSLLQAVPAHAGAPP